MAIWAELTGALRTPKITHLRCYPAEQSDPWAIYTLTDAYRNKL